MALSARYGGNESLARSYLSDAKLMLYKLKQRMGSVDSLWDHKRLNDGTIIQVSVIFGNDTISIVSPSMPEIPIVTEAGELVIFLVYATEPANQCDPRGSWLDQWSPPELWEGVQRFQVLPYKIKTNSTTLMPHDMTQAQLKMNIDPWLGTAPVVQSTPDDSYAEVHRVWMPVGLTEQAIDERVLNQNALYHVWGGVYFICYPQSVAMVSGCQMGWNPKTNEISSSADARTSYALDSQGNVESYEFSLTFGSRVIKPAYFCFVEYCHYETNAATAIEWRVQYKDADGVWQKGPILATDTEEGWITDYGYKWTRNWPVAVLSPEKVIWHKLSRENKGETMYYPFSQAEHYQLGVNIVCGDGTVIPKSRHSYSINRSGTVMGSRYEDELTETLHFGSHLLRSTSITRTGGQCNWQTLTIGMGGGTFHLDYYNPNAEAESYSHGGGSWKSFGSTSAYASTAAYDRLYEASWSSAYNQATGMNTSSGNRVLDIPNHYDWEQKGTKDIKTLMYANSNIDQNFVCFYQYIDEEWMVSFYEANETNNTPRIDTSDRINTIHYMLAVCKNGSLTQTEIATEILGIAGIYAGLHSGTRIKYPSCQINGGVMTYTYSKFNIASSGLDDFSHRVLRVVNIDSTLLPADFSQTYQLADNDERLPFTNHKNRAAIGIHIPANN